MKNLSLFIILVIWVGCAQAPDSDKAKTEGAKKAENKEVKTGSAFKVDLEKSKIGFIGTKPTGQHEGVFKLEQGDLQIVDNQLKAGNFTINIASLKITDLADERAEDLRGHLLSDDFLKAEIYPKSIFSITKVAPISADENVKLEGATHMVSGNLTMLDKTNNITFPAIIKISNNELSAAANFNIDRSEWNISYGNDKSLGDRFIRPEVNIDLAVYANR